MYKMNNKNIVIILKRFLIIFIGEWKSAIIVFFYNIGWVVFFLINYLRFDWWKKIGVIF